MRKGKSSYRDCGVSVKKRSEKYLPKQPGDPVLAGRGTGGF